MQITAKKDALKPPKRTKILVLWQKPIASVNLSVVTDDAWASFCGGIFQWLHHQTQFEVAKQLLKTMGRSSTKENALSETFLAY